MLKIILENGEVSLHKVGQSNRGKDKTMISTITKEISKNKVTGNAHGCWMFSNTVAGQHDPMNTLKVQKVGSASASGVGAVTGASAVGGASVVGGVNGRNGRGEKVRKGAIRKRGTRRESTVVAHTNNVTGGREHKEKFHSLKTKVGSVNADGLMKSGVVKWEMSSRLMQSKSNGGGAYAALALQELEFRTESQFRSKMDM